VRYILIAGAVLACAVLRLESQEPEPLQDNSFLIEEAYNQEPGVVQEISTFGHSIGDDGWLYVFTQEWPLGGVRHQLSYSVLLQHAPDFNSTGLSDGLVNYRFQALGAGGGQVYFAPRLSAVLPIGTPSRGRGNGAFGVQTNLPLTLMLSPRISTHLNAGVTVIPSAENSSGQHATITTFNAGASVVWLVRPLLNLLLEAVWLGNDDVVGSGVAERHSSVFLSPGIRAGINCCGGLQIVPGIAYTISLTDADPDALLLYLSFEHPFRKLQK
jgi:Putative MetA-pathway of phenol degradation